MKNSATLQIEVDILPLGHREHMATGLDRKTYSLKRVLSVIPNITAELRHPRIFVPTRRRIHQKRRITPHHPLSPLPYRRHLIPYLGIACRELPAVRERGLHRRVTMLIEDRDVVAALAERVSSGDAGDSCPDDADASHHSTPLKLETQATGAEPAKSTPSIIPPERPCAIGGRQHHFGALLRA